MTTGRLPIEVHTQWNTYDAPVRRIQLLGAVLIACVTVVAVGTLVSSVVIASLVDVACSSCAARPFAALLWIAIDRLLFVMGIYKVFRALRGSRRAGINHCIKRPY